MTVTRTAACTAKGCPAPRDPDWHVPFCGHGMAGEHQHWPKRSQGGKRIVAFLCHDCHDQIDNGSWGNAVVTTLEDGKQIEIYRAWDLHNETIIEQIIGINDAPSVGQEESDVLAPDDVPVGDGGRGRGSGLAHPPRLTHEQRVDIARSIKGMEWNRQWFAGDTANLWREELGEEAEQYLSDFGYVHETLANMMRVCEQIPPPFRHANLRFSHHVVVADLNREDMEMWLDRCEENEWSVAEFRRQVKGERPRVKRTCPSCGYTGEREEFVK